jgi:hypothetical protein
MAFLILLERELFTMPTKVGVHMGYRGKGAGQLQKLCNVEAG